jgi:hypothetical protein
MTRAYIAPISFGLGDLVVSLPAIQALIGHGRRTSAETWLVARSETQARIAERIVGLAGCVDEDSFDPVSSGDRFVDLRDHPLQRDYWWGSPEFTEAFGWLSINDILGRICTDSGIDAEFSRPTPLRALPRDGLDSTVLFVTETDGPTKRWAADRWGSLAARVAGSGLDVRLLTRDGIGPETRRAGLAEERAGTLGDAVDVLSACRAVIGVDTGLSHVAVQQGTPTVVIARANPVFFRPWPHTRVVTGNPCDDACASIERDYAYHERVSLRGFRWEPRTCPVGARCLDPVQPDDVFRALGELL